MCEGLAEAKPHAMDVTGAEPAMARRLILIRHCEEVPGLARWPRLADVHRWQETEGARPLSPEGREQAAALARLIAEWKPDGLLTSPLTRANETAAAIAGATGLAPEIEPLLAEVSFGRLPGFGPAGTPGPLEGTAGRVRLPRGVWLSLMRGMWLIGVTSGVDSPAAVAARAGALRRRLVERGGLETLAVVSHGVILLHLLANLSGVRRIPALRREFLLRTGEYRVLEARDGSFRQVSRCRAPPGR